MFDITKLGEEKTIRPHSFTAELQPLSLDTVSKYPAVGESLKSRVCGRCPMRAMFNRHFGQTSETTKYRVAVVC